MKIKTKIIMVPFQQNLSIDNFAGVQEPNLGKLKAVKLLRQYLDRGYRVKIVTPIQLEGITYIHYVLEEEYGDD